MDRTRKESAWTEASRRRLRILRAFVMVAVESTPALTLTLTQLQLLAYEG